MNFNEVFGLKWILRTNDKVRECCRT